ncbi:MAG TPA: ABC transporter substrate-binding protein [Bdellovibrionota bacterium]|nr:ABC transporter substrate-binding protein [Bdellovibrionota bacterium]
MANRFSIGMMGVALTISQVGCAASPATSDYTAPVATVESRIENAEKRLQEVPASPRKDLPIVSVAEDFLTSVISLADLSKVHKGKLDADARKRLGEVTTYVDVVALSRRALGARWNTLPKGQRDEFIRTLTEILEEVVYPQAVKISAKSDEFTYKLDPASNKKVVINGAIEREKLGERIANPFEMRLEFDTKSKKVVDAVIEKEAISANLKRQFDRALEKRDFAAIIDLMKKRVAKAKQEAASGGA